MQKWILICLFLVSLNLVSALKIDVPRASSLSWEEEINMLSLENSTVNITIDYSSTKDSSINKIKIYFGKDIKIIFLDKPELKCNAIKRTPNTESWEIFSDVLRSQLIQNLNDSLLIELPFRVKSIKDTLDFRCEFRISAIIRNFLKENEGREYISLYIDSAEEIEDVKSTIYLPIGYKSKEITDKRIEEEPSKGGYKLIFDPDINDSKYINPPEDINLEYESTEEKGLLAWIEEHPLWTTIIGGLIVAIIIGIFRSISSRSRNHQV